MRRILEHLPIPLASPLSPEAEPGSGEDAIPPEVEVEAGPRGSGDVETTFRGRGRSLGSGEAETIF